MLHNATLRSSLPLPTKRSAHPENTRTHSLPRLFSRKRGRHFRDEMS